MPLAARVSVTQRHAWFADQYTLFPSICSVFWALPHALQSAVAASGRTCQTSVLVVHFQTPARIRTRSRKMTVRMPARTAAPDR